MIMKIGMKLIDLLDVAVSNVIIRFNGTKMNIDMQHFSTEDVRNIFTEEFLQRCIYCVEVDEKSLLV